MKNLRVLAVAFLLIAPASALAQAPAPAATTSPVTVVAPGHFDQSPAQQALNVVVPAAPPAIIDSGTIGGQVLIWVMATFGTTIGTAITAWVVMLMKKAGIQGADLLRDKLQETIVNGLNLGAKEAAQDLAGRGQVEIKNAAVAKAVVYAQTHGADTLKKLGLDPTSPEAVQAIKARIETAIADDATPTAPVLDAPPPAVKLPASPAAA